MHIKTSLRYNKFFYRTKSFIFQSYASILFKVQQNKERAFVVQLSQNDISNRSTAFIKLSFMVLSFFVDTTDLPLRTHCKFRGMFHHGDIFMMISNVSTASFQVLSSFLKTLTKLKPCFRLFLALVRLGTNNHEYQSKHLQNERLMRLTFFFLKKNTEKIFLH